MAQTPEWNDDFVAVIRALNDADVEFLLVGAHATAVHGVPRATGDLDIWVKPSADNAPRVFEALVAFGAPVAAGGCAQPIPDLDASDE
jgi:hypothetical protein